MHLTLVEGIAFLLLRMSCFIVLGFCFSRGSSILTMFHIIPYLAVWWSCRAFDAVLTFTQSRVNHAPGRGQKQKFNHLKSNLRVYLQRYDNAFRFVFVTQYSLYL